MPIRSSAIPRDKLLLFMEQIRKTVIEDTAVQMHQPVIKNIRTGVDMIAAGPCAGGCGMYQTDILIIGAGAVGIYSSELSKYKINTMVVDKK